MGYNRFCWNAYDSLIFFDIINDTSACTNDNTCIKGYSVFNTWGYTKEARLFKIAVPGYMNTWRKGYKILKDTIVCDSASGIYFDKRP